jgi:RNA polymerase sigma-70 factor (ECF subfamily)
MRTLRRNDSVPSQWVKQIQALMVTNAGYESVFITMIAITEIPWRPAGNFKGGPPMKNEPAELWRDLFSDLAGGDSHAIEVLYDACSREIFGLALWRTGSVDDASDVVQALFVTIVERRAELVRVERPRAWLFSIAHHLAVDVTRRRKPQPTRSIDSLPFLTAPDTDPVRAIDAANASRCLAELPASQRDTIYLKHFADCTFQAIGKITRVPTFTAASRYRLGMAKLRKLMGGMK